MIADEQRQARPLGAPLRTWHNVRRGAYRLVLRVANGLRAFRVHAAIALQRLCLSGTVQQRGAQPVSVYDDV